VSAEPVTSYLLDGVSVSGTAVRLGIYPDCGMNVERVTVYCNGQAFELACSNGLDAPGWLRRYQENRLAEEISGAQLAGSEESYILTVLWKTRLLRYRQAGRQPTMTAFNARRWKSRLRERKQYYAVLAERF
jgi:hypothetical protein